MPALIQTLLRRPLLVLLLFCAAAFAVYSPALGGARVWDDDYLIGENPFFRSPVFAGEVFRHFLFFESQSTYYRPVQNLSYIADYWLWGGGTAGFHATNVLLHTLAAWLIWRLLARLLRSMAGEKAEAAALAVAAVWLVHPIHNAAVAYIAGRADSLAAVFCAGAWLLWLRAREAPLAWKVAGAVGACALLLAGLCSKEIALMWTLLFLLHAFAFEKARLRSVVALLAVLGAVVGGYAVLRALPEARAGSIGAAQPLAERALLALKALGDYAGLMVFPQTLMMERSLSGAGRAGWWLAASGTLALGAVAWLVWRRDEGSSLRRFGAAWFFVAFIPISNLIPLNAEVAEHWIYLASIGLLVFGAGLLLRARFAPVLVAVAVCGFGVRTWFRAHDWAGPEAFARQTIASGGATARLLSYYAAELGKRKAYAAQERVLRRMLEFFPGLPVARINLGICLNNQGRKDEGAKFLEMPSAAEADASPRTWSAALNLGGLRLEEGRPDAALALAREWRPRFPKTWELAALESMALEAMGSPADAIPPVVEFTRANWWHRPSQLRLASLALKAGLPDAAASILRDAARLDVRDPVPHMEIARIEINAGRAPGAATALEEAISRAPRDPEPRMLLAALLEQCGRPAEAAAALREAEALRRAD